MENQFFQGEAVPNRVWWHLGISLVIAGQAMVFSLGININSPDPFSVAYWVVHGVLIGSTLIVAALLGPRLVQETWKSLRSGKIQVEAMFLLSAAGAWVASLVSTLRGEGPVFYEVVAIVLSIYTLGKTVGLQMKDKAWKEVRRLRETSGRARLMKADGQSDWQNLAIVRAGMQVIVEPGEMITVDGRVVQGQSFVVESSMTGEPAPVSRGPGSSVLAGTYATDGRLIIEVEASLGDRTLDAVLGAVEAAGLKPSRWQEQADYLMQGFVPAITCISLATFLIWQLYVGWQLALFHSMAVLLVACPCALGLATPIAVWTALWNLAGRGLVIKTGAFLDTLARTDTWVFDKTGTLSRGQMQLGAWHWQPSCELNSKFYESLAAVVESGFNHPIVKAFSTCKSDSDFRVIERQWVAGCGVIGKVVYAEASYTVRVGALHWINSDLISQSKSIGLEVNGKYIGFVELIEVLRPDAQTSLTALAQTGALLIILSGDPEPEWDHVANIKIQAGLSSSEKAAVVRRLRAEGKTIMVVGDGLNDAQAMAEASAAIAMGEGTILTQSSAQAVLMGENLDVLVQASHIARRVHVCIRFNMFLALVYNVLGVGLAAAGYLHPVVAALIMAVSSSMVAYRAVRSAQL